MSVYQQLVELCQIGDFLSAKKLAWTAGKYMLTDDKIMVIINRSANLQVVKALAKC